jgi:hypothetical protein
VWGAFIMSDERGEITNPILEIELVFGKRKKHHKHGFLIEDIDQFGIIYRCFKCGKIKTRDWNNKVRYF